jgi:hypothetical protein
MPLTRLDTTPLMPAKRNDNYLLKLFLPPIKSTLRLQKCGEQGTTTLHSKDCNASSITQQIKIMVTQIIWVVIASWTKSIASYASFNVYANFNKNYIQNT